MLALYELTNEVTEFGAARDAGERRYAADVLRCYPLKDQPVYSLLTTIEVRCVSRINAQNLAVDIVTTSVEVCEVEVPGPSCL